MLFETGAPTCEAAAHQDQQTHFPKGHAEHGTAAVASNVTTAPVAAPAPATTLLPANATLPQLVLEHPHNKLVHFPIAFALGAALLMVAGRWRRDAAGVARVLLLLGSLGGVASAAAGLIQADAIAAGLPPLTLAWHRNLGLATAGALPIALWLSGRATMRRWLPFAGVALALLVAATGFLGGVLSHG